MLDIRYQNLRNIVDFVPTEERNVEAKRTKKLPRPTSDLLSQLNVIQIQSFLSVDGLLAGFTLCHFQLTQDGTIYIAGAFLILLVSSLYHRSCCHGHNVFRTGICNLKTSFSDDIGIGNMTADAASPPKQIEKLPVFTSVILEGILNKRLH